jgi:hypothetical protein
MSHIPDAMPNILIVDDTWVSTDFEWLSFQDQPTRTFEGRWYDRRPR